MTTRQLRPRREALGPVDPTDPLAKRDELERKRSAAYLAYTEHTGKRQAAERALSSLERRVHQHDVAGGDDALDNLESELGEAQHRLNVHLGRANRALDATKTLEAEVNQLHSQDFAAFAQEADEVSKSAQVAVDDFVVAWRRAVAAWATAQMAWAPVCTAVRIQGLGPFPVGEHALSEIVNGEAYPRPSAIEVNEASELPEDDGYEAPEITDDVLEAAVDD
jgi:hypothetical protein